MKGDSMKPTMFNATNVSRLMLAVTFAFSVSGQALGQSQAPPGAGPPANINPRAEDRSRQLAEGRLRRAEMDAVAESEKEKLVEAAIVHMKEDFTRIQVIRNDIARNLVAKKPLDYKLIEEQTSEIHRRAKSLNLYMMAHGHDVKEEKVPSDLKQDEMVVALVKLCKLIDSFTENPALKNVAMLDVKNIDKAKEDKARADQDLLDVIKLSENIQKRAQDVRVSN
jgi:hypothetical protein